VKLRPHSKEPQGPKMASSPVRNRAACVVESGTEVKNAVND
jgi:hypothetical protein